LFRNNQAWFEGLNIQGCARHLMIRRITLQNYMSHANTVIEPAAGLTVLVGPNNCGKSAVVSALETLCYNPPLGAYMVRHEEKEAQVTVETDDGHVIVWKRRRNYASYVIDDREVHRGVPDDLHLHLRLPKVDAGENSDPFDIHFANQKSPIFLLDESGRRAAVFFASSSDAAILLEMQKRHRAKVSDQKQEKRRVEAEIARLDGRLEILEAVQPLVESMVEANERYNNLIVLQGQIRTMQEDLKKLVGCTTERERIVERFKCVSPLKPVPRLDETGDLERQIFLIDEATHDRQLEEGRDSVLGALVLPPALANAPALSNAIGLLVGEHERQSRWSGQSNALDLLSQPPTIEDAETLDQICRRLWTRKCDYQRTLDEAACLNELQVVPAIADNRDLQETVRCLSSAKLACNQFSDCRNLLLGLLSVPQQDDVSGFSRIISDIDSVTAALARLNDTHSNISAEMQECENTIRSLERSALIPAHPSWHTWKSSRVMVLLAATAIMVLLVVYLGSRFFTPSTTDGTELNVDGSVPGALSKPDEKGTKDPAKKKEEPAEAKAARIQQVRQILNDADMASAKGRHLEAVLAYGQAAISYPDELAEVERPESVQAKFMNALSRYQAEVERAIARASERKGGEK
jgi:hypothetical protein